MTPSHEPLNRQEVVRTLVMAINAINEGNYRRADLVFSHLLRWLHEDEAMEERNLFKATSGSLYVNQ
jgi:hypothetical protein